MNLDLAILTFDHTEGAERAYANLDPSEGPWRRELALVERHRHGRIVVRGTVAGHYVNVGDDSDAIGRDTAIGALTGAVVGALFGPLGFAVGLVGGGSIGGAAQSTHHAPPQEGELFDQIRAQVPDGHSAVLLLASPEHVDAMIEAFADTDGTLSRHAVPEETAANLLAAVPQAPPTAPPDAGA